MATTFGVVDLFAGPGGLAEGFSKVKDASGHRPFKIELSAEMEASAHQTLLLRSFLRQFENDEYPQEYFDALNSGTTLPDWAESPHRYQWDVAQHEALQLELGKDDEVRQIIDLRIDQLKGVYGGNLGIIGGPPCQAYSLVGRSRNRGIANYIPEEDHRHYLYKEYIRILTRLEPAFFVMENVKGILSSRVDNRKVFDRILEDLQSVQTGDGAGYELMPIAPPAPKLFSSTRPTDFIVRAERFGVPQARHRVIVVGIRSDIARKLSPEQKSGGLLTMVAQSTTVRTVLGSMPKLRSNVSRSSASRDHWFDAMGDAFLAVETAIETSGDPLLAEALRAAKRDFADQASGLPTLSLGSEDHRAICNKQLRDWLLNDRLTSVPNHEARSHMRGDLGRYLYAAIFAQAHNRSPKAHEYPGSLAPSHANWESGKFADRFRVQDWNHPSTTITSHISKDGHYYIHPDPAQCRSLTVREAARLQAFPDDYFFKGNRTQQYVQVGNAVPPYLANQIGNAVLRQL